MGKGRVLWKAGWVLKQPLSLPKREEVAKTGLKSLPLTLSMWLCSELVGAVAGHAELNICEKEVLTNKGPILQKQIVPKFTLWAGNTLSEHFLLEES